MAASLIRSVIQSSHLLQRNLTSPFLNLSSSYRTRNTPNWKYFLREVPPKKKPEPEKIPDEIINQVSYDTIEKVNKQITEKTHGRLFAIVHVCGKQFKVTTEDLIVLEGYWAPTAGDHIRLEKVLLVGCSDFTVIGSPILPLDLVSVNATVIEKTLSHTRYKFRKVKRKQYMRINFLRAQQTYLRITGIEFKGKVNEDKDTDGLQDRIF